MNICASGTGRLPGRWPASRRVRTGAGTMRWLSLSSLVASRGGQRWGNNRRAR
jgi:hypothetical protein